VRRPKPSVELVGNGHPHITNLPPMWAMDGLCPCQRAWTRHHVAWVPSYAPRGIIQSPSPPSLPNTPSWAIEGPCPCPPKRIHLHGTWVPSSAPSGSYLPFQPPTPPGLPVFFALPHYVPDLTDELLLWPFLLVQKTVRSHLLTVYYFRFLSVAGRKMKGGRAHSQGPRTVPSGRTTCEAGGMPFMSASPTSGYKETVETLYVDTDSSLGCAVTDRFRATNFLFEFPFPHIYFSSFHSSAMTQPPFNSPSQLTVTDFFSIPSFNFPTSPAHNPGASSSTKTLLPHVPVRWRHFFHYLC